MAGSEVLSGSNGDDSIQGTAENEVIAGGDGDDLLHGGGGDDLLQGGEDNDELRGGDGNDVLQGGDDDDLLIGGAGQDRLYGGLGADRFVVDAIVSEPDEIMDFRPEEGDTLWLQTANDDAVQETIIKPRNGKRVKVDLKKITVDNVRLKYNGDVEVRVEGKKWKKVVGIRRSDLRLKAEKSNDRLRLIFSKKF